MIPFQLLYLIEWDESSRWTSVDNLAEQDGPSRQL